MTTKLTPKQEKFCREYLLDFNSARAARDSGYSEKTARTQGSKLLTNVDVKTRLAELIKEFHPDDTADMIRKCIAELQMIAFGDYKDFVTWGEHGVDKWIESKDLGDKTRLVQEVSETISMSGGSRKLKLYDKRWAFEMLGKYYGFLKEHVEISNPDGTLTPIVNIIIPSNGREKQ